MGLKKTVFGKSKIKPNTFIGGVSATINTPALIANKLGISVSRIKAFSVIGSDIQFAVIGGNYSLPANCFNENTSITYFDDKVGLVVGCVGNSQFSNCTNLLYLKLKNLINMGYQFCLNCVNLTEVLLTEVRTCGWEDFEGCVKLITIYDSFKKLTSIGNKTFYNCKLIVSLDLQNVGAVSINTVGACFYGMTNLVYLNVPNLTTSVVSPTYHHLSAMIQNCPNLTTAIFTSLNYFGTNFANGASSLVNLDLSNVTKACLQYSFQGTTNLSNLIMPNINTIITGTFQAFVGSKVNNIDFSKIINTSLINNETFNGTTGLSTLDLTCFTTTLGSTASNNSILYLIKTGVTITVKTALQTCNAGAPDGDLVYASDTRGAIIVYV